MVILHLLSSRGGEPDDMRRQIMVIRTPFRHPETIESDGTQRQIIVVLHLFSSRGDEPDEMRRQIMVILHLMSSRGGKPDDMWR